MYFVLLTFVLVFLLALIGYFLHTQSQIVSLHRTSGPRAISEWVGQRNRKGLIIVFILLVVVAFLEALIPEFAYSIQDAQAVLYTGLPEWGIIFLRGGSISWALYLSIFSGFVLGQVSGTILGCRRYARTQGFGFGEVF